MLANWGSWDAAIASAVARVEVHRTLARVAQQGRLTAGGFAEAALAFSELEQGVRWLPLTPGVIDAACEPLPTVVKALDAIHLVTARLVRDIGVSDLVFATHDRQLAQAATTIGFDVAGV